MVTASLSEYDIQKLEELIGSSMICFRSQEIDRWDKVYGNLEIISNRKRLEVRNEQKPIRFFGNMEDIAIFSIIEKRADEAFELMVLDKPIMNYEINDKIINISIITDYIQVFNNMNEVIYEISMDMAIVFHMEKQIITFSKGWYFDESINVIKGDNYCKKIRSTEQVKEDWLDPEIDEGYVHCVRNETFIK